MTPVLQELSLVAYRGIAGLVLEDLTPISLVVGDNNTGKSSILEAAALALRPTDPGQWVQVAQHRDIDLALVDGLWAQFPGGSVLHLGDGVQESNGMELKARIAGQERGFVARCLASQIWSMSDKTSSVILNVRVAIDGGVEEVMYFDKLLPAQWKRDAFVRAFTVTPATHRSTRRLIELLSRIVDEGKKQLAIHLLQIFDPAVEDLQVSSSQGREAIRVTHKGRGVVDLSSFGDGMRRSAALALSLTKAAPGVLLIDEIEAGIHHTVLPHVLSRLFEAAAHSKVQILATTHSLEAVDASIAAAEELGAGETLSAYYLKRAGGQPAVRRYDQDKVRRLREGGLDIR